MEQERPEMSSGLLRQRRNLIISSIILSLYFGSGAKIESLSLVGIKIGITNPTVFSFGLCLIFTYFFWRYIQYYASEPCIKTLKAHKSDNIFELTAQIIEKKINKEISRALPSCGVIYYRIPFQGTWRSLTARDHNSIASLPYKSTLSKNLTWKIPVEMYFGGSKDDMEKIVDITEVPFSLHPKYQSIIEIVDGAPNDPRSGGFTALGHVHISLFKPLFIKISAASTYILSDTIFSDYQLPIYLALTSAFFSSIVGT